VARSAPVAAARSAPGRSEEEDEAAHSAAGADAGAAATSGWRC